MVPMAAYEVCSTRLEAAEEELQDTRAELRALEQRWSSLEAERAELEAGMAKQRCLLASTEDVLTSCRAERAQLADVTAELRLQLARLANDNEAMQLGLLDAKQHRQQVSLPFNLTTIHDSSFINSTSRSFVPTVLYANSWPFRSFVLLSLTIKLAILLIIFLFEKIHSC